MLAFLKTIAGPLINLLAAVVPYLFGRKVGKETEKRKQAEEALEDVKESKEIRDRLDSDPEYSDRVQDEFTRREE